MKREREFIRASGTKGFKKSQVEVIVRSPQEKSKRVLLAEVSHVAPDKRRTRKKNYVTLCTFGNHGRRKLTYDVMKGTGSATVELGFHFDFDVFDLEAVAKHIAFFRVLKYPVQVGFTDDHIHLSILDREVSKKLELFVAYYEQQFREKIRKKKASFRRFLRKYHTKRHRKA